MRSEVTRLLNENRENYLREIDSSFRDNPKRTWLVLRQKSESCSITDPVTTTSSSNGQLGSLHVSHGDQSDQSPRPTAANPVEIATFFNTYFASVFSSENLPDELPTETSGPPVLTELTLTEPEVETILNSLDTNKATGPVKFQPESLKIPLLLSATVIVAPSLCNLFNKSLQHGIVPRDSTLRGKALVSCWKR